jgi:hypothetical protein
MAFVALASLAPLIAFRIPVNAQNLPLAIKGYDPVGYFTMGKAVPGVPAFEHVWDEHLYRFANAAHRDLFKNDPVHYAPQFGIYCAISLARGEVVEANPEYWLISEDKLYLFGKPIGPELFEKALANNVAKANENARRLIPR